MRFSELEKPRVAILGAGREGRAVWRQLRKRYPGKPLALFSESSFEESFVQMTDSGIDHLYPGAFDVVALEDYDVLVRSAGISPYRAELRELGAKGVRFTTASNIWFAENPNARTICISGTLGKSTTASLTAHLLRQSGLDVCLAGNIGRPMLDVDESPDWWVIELSSYQLSDLNAKVEVAVLLNLSEEHIDWHGGLQRYHSDKLKLARLACDGHVIANHADEILLGALEDDEAVTWFNHTGGWSADRNSVFRNHGGPAGQAEREAEKTSGLPMRLAAPPALPGQHNMHNLAAALTIMELLGLDQSLSLIHI